MLIQAHAVLLAELRLRLGIHKWCSLIRHVTCMLSQMCEIVSNVNTNKTAESSHIIER